MADPKTIYNWRRLDDRVTTRTACGRGLLVARVGVRSCCLEVPTREAVESTGDSGFDGTIQPSVDGSTLHGFSGWFSKQRWNCTVTA